MVESRDLVIGVVESIRDFKDRAAKSSIEAVSEKRFSFLMSLYLGE